MQILRTALAPVVLAVGLVQVAPALAQEPKVYEVDQLPTGIGQLP